MEWLADPTIWMGLATLVVLEIILGIDNLVFIAILADKLPPEQRDKARVIGLSLALVMRLGLLAVVAWIAGLVTPLFSVWGHEFSGRDLILLIGGVFLLFKATMELHERLEGRQQIQNGKKVYAAFGVVLAQIVVLDAVFSLDSVITAVGMVDELGVMYAAVIISMAVMLLASKPLTTFVSKHPTVIVLCLGFLLMIGFSLVAEGLGFKIPKGYLYAAIAFSILIEGFNQWTSYNRERDAQTIPFRQRTADAVVRLLGARPGTQRTSETEPGEVERVDDGEQLEAAEHDMIRSVLTLAERPVSTVMTVRSDIEWIDATRGLEHATQRLIDSPHTRLLVCDGELDQMLGVVQSSDLLSGVLQGKALNVSDFVREPLVVPEGTSALRVLEQIRAHQIPLAVVVDEYGGIEGMVTANDLLATIAGDLADTQDADYGATVIDETSWRVDASMTVHDLEVATGVKLPVHATYVTLSGMFMHFLDRMPNVGDEVVVEGYKLVVETLERRRVGVLRIEKLE